MRWRRFTHIDNVRIVQVGVKQVGALYCASRQPEWQYAPRSGRALTPGLESLQSGGCNIMQRRQQLKAPHACKRRRQAARSVQQRRSDHHIADARAEVNKIGTRTVIGVF